MKRFLKVLLVLQLLYSIAGYGQSLLHGDTITLIKSNFNTPAPIKKLIDEVYAHKEQAPNKAIRFAVYAYNRALDIKDIRLQAGALNVTGAAYEDLGNYPTALKQHYQALRLFEKAGDAFGIAMVNNNIGRVYMEAGKLKDALAYFAKAMQAAGQTHQDSVLLYIYANYANTYTQLGQLNKALYYGLRSDSVNAEYGLKVVQARNDGNIGAIYFFMKDYAAAQKYYQLSAKLALQANDSITYYKQQINIGEVFEVRHTDGALPCYLSALRYFVQAKDAPSVAYVAGDLADYYTARNNYRQAMLYYKQSVKAGQQHTNIQAAKNMAQLQTQYETEKKEQQINLLNKENTIQKLSIGARNTTIGIIFGLFVLSGIFAVLFYNRKQLKQKTAMQQQQLEHQDVLTKAVIEAEEKERKRIASDLHDGVGQMFSAVKMNLSGLFDRIKIDRDEERFLAEKTLALVDESCKEVRVISHQMMPNMLLRSGIASDVKSFIEKIDSESLKVSVEATGFKDKLESNVETILYRVIQETVNNVIKHAKATKLDIKLTREVSGITAIVTDNGIGFNTEFKDDFAGIGLKNIAARIEYLKGTVTYYSSPGKGTSVNIWVPVA